MVDVPDAPDALVEKLRAAARIWRESSVVGDGLANVLTEAADRIVNVKAWGDRCKEWVDRLGPLADENPALRARLAEAERLVDDLAWFLPRFPVGQYKSERDALLDRANAFLAGSATPPEAPQQTAVDDRTSPLSARRVGEFHHGTDAELAAEMEPTPLERLAAAGYAYLSFYEYDGQCVAQARRALTDCWTGAKAGPTPDAALLALVDSMAPTEADRP